MRTRILLVISFALIFSSIAFAMPEITSIVSTEFGIYSPYAVSVKPNVTPYSINPDLSNISNLHKFKFTEKEKALLAKNGFVASQTKFKQIYDIYKFCQENDLPVFVTTDSMLHVYHILYDYTLRILEVRKLSDDLNKLNAIMLKNAIYQYEKATGPLAKKAALKNMAYFSVASVILDPSIEVPLQAKDLVAAELRLIDEHEGFVPSPIFGYEEDYSQYVPRGHYTRNDTLKRYFRSMMWYGRMMFRITPREGKEKGIEETLQAINIISAIKKGVIGGEPALKIWDRIYEPTVFFVGKSDDLNVYEYMEIMENIYGLNYDSLLPDELADIAKIEAFIEEVKEYRNPFINSTIVWRGEDIATVTKGFRFMGQRYIPDSHMFQELVDDKVLYRMFPKGLDIMAILGSERAYDILINVYKEDQYPNYVKQMAKMRDAFGTMNDEVWAQNLYWNWLYVLMPLLEERGAGYPIFMQSPAWLDKDLSTALGSWTELRHDTILYAKQSYTMKTSLPPIPQLVKGYVEPNPELYARLAALARFTREGLSDRGLMLKEFSAKYSQFEDLLLALREISELELTNQPLNTKQYGMITNIGKTLESITTFPSTIGAEIENDEDDEMAIVADVHTDDNSKQVLEEGVGYPMNIFVVVPVNGELRITQGAIFSYYEFTWPMNNRLTDGQWQDKIATDPPDLPIWTGSFIDLSMNPKLGEPTTVESEMSWQPIRMDVQIDPDVIDVGSKIEVIAVVQGNLEALPIVTLRQNDITQKAEMKSEFGKYTALIDTKGMMPGSAQLSVTGFMGEEEVSYQTEILLSKATAVDLTVTDQQSKKDHDNLKNKIYKAYPNPFNPEVWIPFDIEQNNNVTIEIYDALGRLIRVLDLGYKTRGSYVDKSKAAHWDGRNSYGEQVSSGIYFYKLISGDFMATGKMIALK